MLRTSTLILFSLIAVAGCEVDKRSILAPEGTQLAVSSAAVYLPVRQVTSVTITARETDGSPAEDGTEILITAKLGRLDQRKVRTQAGSAVVQYSAGEAIGTEELTGWSDTTRASVSFPIASAPLQSIEVTPEVEFLPPGGGSVLVTALARSPEGAPVAGLPIQFATSAGTLNVTGPVTTSAQGKATARLSTTTTATVRANILNLMSEEALIPVRPPVTLVLTRSPTAPVVGDAVTFTVTASSGGTPARGVAGLTFGDGKSAVLGTITGNASVQHSYETKGSFNATALFLDAYGLENRATVRVDVADKPEPPPPPGNGLDQIDARTIIWLNPASVDVSNWAVTSTVTSTSINNNTICINHTKAGQWPLVSIDENPPNIEGNPMIVVKFNGQWYGAGFDWFGEGRTCKYMPPDEMGRDQVRVSPMDSSWRGPQSGDLVGLLVSAPSSNRIPVRSVLERSNIVLVRWP